MVNHPEIRYYVLLEQLNQAMTDLDTFDLQRIFGVLAELCKILHISKAVTTFYDDPKEEAQGKGEDFVCYDTGESQKLVLEKRAVSPTRMIVKTSVYQAEGAEPFSPLERTRIELIEQIILTYISKHRLQRAVERMMYTDFDGYHNMQGFFAAVNRLRAAGRLADKAAVRFNLKHFTLINQQFGRAVGDTVMKTYYRTLEAALGDEGFIGRLGGDNFVALCELDRLPEVLQILKGRKIQLAAEKDSGARNSTGEKGGARVPVQNSVMVSALAGIFVISRGVEVENTGEIMDKVTSAFQAAKLTPSEDIQFYSDELGQQKDKIMRIQQQFAEALDQDEFLVYYQPKVNIDTKELIGAEALCRWSHEGKIVPPMEFIPTLELGSEICALDFYMLDHVCRDIRR